MLVLAVLAAALVAASGVGAAPPSSEAPPQPPPARRPHQCCAPEVLLQVHPKACADGAKVPLVCPHIFLLDQENEDDKWIERADGSLLVDNVTVHA